jgi:hypothetical protein
MGRQACLIAFVYAGRIDAGDLLVALRALGFEPRKDEVKKLMSDNDKENTGTITKQQFVEIFRAKWVRKSFIFAARASVLGCLFSSHASGNWPGSLTPSLSPSL